VVTPDGRPVEGAVIARDLDRDIAVVRALGARVPAVTTGDPYSLRPGSLVFAVGHPLGIKDAVSVGVFQAVGSVPPGYGLAEKRPRRGRSPSIPWVQADVRLAPGNSGGPIADVEGNVIGVAAMIVSGLALAVPAPDVERLLSSLG
jgi:serine protease Do